jgi:hypothetical protein
MKNTHTTETTPHKGEIDIRSNVRPPRYRLIASSNDDSAEINLINWRRRLFRQHDPKTPVVHAKDMGFTGRAGKVVIDDQYRLIDFRAAATAKQRAEAAEGWLRKIARNAERGYDEVGAPAILEAVDRAFDAVASAIIIAADKLKNELRQIDGMEDFEDRFEKYRHPDVKLTELHRFPLPGQNGSRSDGDSLDEDWEMKPWPQLRLDLTPPSDDERN